MLSIRFYFSRQKDWDLIKFLVTFCESNHLCLLNKPNLIKIFYSIPSYRSHLIITRRCQLTHGCIYKLIALIGWLRHSFSFVSC